MYRSSSPIASRAPARCTGRTSMPIDASICSDYWPSRARWLNSGQVWDRMTWSSWSAMMSESRGDVAGVGHHGILECVVRGLDVADQQHGSCVCRVRGPVREFDGSPIKDIQVSFSGSASVGVDGIWAHPAPGGYLSVRELERARGADFRSELVDGLRVSVDGLSRSDSRQSERAEQRADAKETNDFHSGDSPLESPGLYCRAVKKRLRR